MFAIRCPNVSLEIAALSVLNSLSEQSCPVLPVLRSGVCGPHFPEDAVALRAGAGKRQWRASIDEEARVAVDADAFTLSITRGDMLLTCERVVARFGLNEDQVRGSVARARAGTWSLTCARVDVVPRAAQQRVLDSVLRWFRASDDSETADDKHPVTLVHGVFGTSARCRAAHHMHRV